MDYVEVSAKTVDDAITKACIELEVSSDRLDIQVISEGSSGFLGFGSKPAVIKVRKKEEPDWNLEEMAAPEEEKKNPPIQEETPVKAEAPKKEPAKNEQPRKEPVKKEASKKENSGKPMEKEPSPVKTKEEIVMMKASAQSFLDGVFKAMELPVDITMEYNPEQESLDIDFAGEDMGILIGKRGQTLDSLQYLSLIHIYPVEAPADHESCF